MRSRRFQATIISAVTGILLNLILPLAPAFAATPTNAPGTGEGLELSPPVIQLAGNPGQTITTTIRIRNITAQNLYAAPKADDFGAKGEDGEPQILLDETEATRYSLKYWVSPMPTLLLVPQEIKTATVKIVIPANAEPGGHFGVVRFTATPAGVNGNGVALSASIGSLILLKVNGPITEKLDLVELFASQNSSRGGFFESGPITITARIRNSGTIHLQPVGAITVTDTFGKKVANITVNDPPRNILPDSIRRFDEVLSKKWLFGRYTANIKLTYGTTNGVLAGSLVFWVIPYRLILIILLIVVALFFGLRYGLRRYNRYIIDQAQGKKRRRK